MTETVGPIETPPPGDEAAPAAPPPPKRSPGHRGQDVRDTVAELAARAHEISLEAGSKMSGALRDVIGAAAGMTAFAVESARDLVNYMVRRGQMTQEEADKLIREVEAAMPKRKLAPSTPPPAKPVTAPHKPPPPPPPAEAPVAPATHAKPVAQ